MTARKTYPRLLIRWRGGRWEWHMLLRGRVPNENTMFAVGDASTWTDEMAWLSLWRRQDELVKQMTVMNLFYKLNRDYRFSDGFTLTATPSPRTAWGAGGMHCQK